MAVLRKIALGLLLAASAAVLLVAAAELWNYRQWAYLPFHDAGSSDNDRARALDDRMDLLSKRVGDMELLVLILLGTSGLYAIVFVVSSYLSASSFSRQASETIDHVQDQIGLAMGDLRELQERTEQRLQEILAAAQIPAPAEARPAPVNYEQQLVEIAARLQAWQEKAGHDRELSEQARLEMMRDENAAAHLESIAGSELGTTLPLLYLGYARIHARQDPDRSRFYLDRALRLAPPKSPLASEIHYELACRLAASRDFEHAIGELSTAFQHQFRALEERLAIDIDEGGRLYELASTPPFDKSVNDLLLSMSIGMG
jgi:hypothetical protein